MTGQPRKQRRGRVPRAQQADRDKVWIAVQKIAASEEAPQAVRSGARALARALDLIDVPEPGMSVREALEEPLRDHGLGELRSWVVTKVAAKLRSDEPELPLQVSETALRGRAVRHVAPPARHRRSGSTPTRSPVQTQQLKENAVTATIRARSEALKIQQVGPAVLPEMAGIPSG